MFSIPRPLPLTATAGSHRGGSALTLGDVVALLEERVELGVDLDVLVMGVGILLAALGVGIVDVGDEELGLERVDATAWSIFGLDVLRAMSTYTLKRKVLLTGRILLLIGSGRYWKTRWSSIAI